MYFWHADDFLLTSLLDYKHIFVMNETCVCIQAGLHLVDGSHGSAFQSKILAEPLPVRG